ncbi:MAG TPA: GNAT family N-acetyltransferase [Chthoniobacterales bacterium]
MRSSLDYSVGRNVEDLLSVESEWQGLWELSERTTPFQSPGWLIPCVRVFSPKQLRVLLVWRGIQLIGLFPFWIDYSSGRAVLKILGQGVSDYLDGVCREAELVRIAPLVETWLRRELASCESAEFCQLKEHAVLTAVPRVGTFREEVVPGEACPVLSLADCSSISALPPAIRRNLEFGTRQAEKLGPLEFEVANEESFEAAIDSLYSLHSKRWQLRGLSGVCATKEQQTFYRQAFKSLHATSTSQLFILRLAGRPVAALAALLQKQVLYYYLGAFDPDHSKLGPGNLIILRVLEFAVRVGCHSFDFLRGREPYKYRWGARDQTTLIRKLFVS